MKKVLSIGLLFVFVFQLAGYYLIFKIRQHEIRSVFQNHLKSGYAFEKLVTINWDDSKIAAQEDKITLIDQNEILYKGALYDVVRKEIHGTITTYFCIPDHDETRLIAQLTRFVNNEMNQNSSQKKQNNTLKQLFNVFILSLNRPEFKAFATDLNSNSKYDFSIQLWETFPLTPPPKV